MDIMTCCKLREGEEPKKVIQERLRIEGKMKKQWQRAHRGENEQPLSVE